MGKIRDYIRVTVRLKKDSYVEHNKYECTINGEKRIVTMRNVTWFSPSIDYALTSFNPREVISVEIVDTGLEQIEKNR